MDHDLLLRRLAARLEESQPAADGRPRIAHLHRLPVRPARTEPLPDDLPEPLPGRLELAGISSLYHHQARTLELLRAGRHVIVATGTASGKSLCYQLPLAEAVLRDDRATALYLAPTKALAHDQLRALRALRLPQLRAATYDGDTPRSERAAVRRTANVLLTNPDMLHVGILPAHRRWSDFLARLALVVVDECHVARGVFGSHVAAVLRRLRRVCAYHATGAGAAGAAAAGRDGRPEDGSRPSGPAFVLASATIGNPAEHASNLTGLDVAAVTQDGSPKGPVLFGLWEPPLTDVRSGARRSTLSEAADLLADLVSAGPATLAFVRSRRGAEVVAMAARRALPSTEGAEGAKRPECADTPTVLAYRAGYLPHERRAVERGLIDGTVSGVAATDALELGVDIGALDAVIVAGWPGTAASLWQQAGRAGRRGAEAVVVFVADDNPLDHYLLANPSDLWTRPVEQAVSDVTNPYILTPHLRCAAWELPLSPDEQVFSPARLGDLLTAEVADGRLRERTGRYFPAGRGSPAARVSLRSAGGEPFTIVDAETGVLIGDVDEARAYRTVHAGAVYVHQGSSYRIDDLDLDRRVAVARPDAGDEYTQPRSDTDIRVLATTASEDWGRCRMHHGSVEVSTRVRAYERRRLYTNESLGVTDLELPPVQLATTALWLTLPARVLAEAGLSAERLPGAAHAAEHAAIALLPLFAMCDRWDIGGVSTASHPDTGQPTIFIYDGCPGGAGISERGYRSGDAHLRATLAAVASCACADGCPSCVQSPKCGNGNEPLDKLGAVLLLAAALDERAAAHCS